MKLSFDIEIPGAVYSVEVEVWGNTWELIYLQQSLDDDPEGSPVTIDPNQAASLQDWPRIRQGIIEHCGERCDY